MESEYEINLKSDFEIFLKKFGKFLKDERENNGYKSVESYSNTIGIDQSTISKYERGEENITLRRIYTLLRSHRKSHEFIVKLFTTNGGDEELIKTLDTKQQVTLQVRNEIELKVGKEVANSLDYQHYDRINRILILCLNKSLKKKDLRDKLNLKTYTIHFNKSLEICITNNWISMTKPDKPNSHLQEYFTTKLGKDILLPK